MAHKVNRGRVCKVIFLSAAGIAAALCLLVPFFKARKKAADYAQAVQLVIEAQYTQAEELLEPLKENEESEDADASNLYHLCAAHRCYSAEDYFYAQRYMKKVDMEALPAEITQREAAFLEEAVSAYDAYCEEADEKRRQEYQAKKEAEAAKVYEVPCVGMPESRIDTTNLGASSRVKTDYTANKRKRTTYYYIRDGLYIFNAVCIDGEVISVRDLRNDPVTVGDANRKSSSDVGPSTEEFVNAEDFYEYYYDDFIDYEEAEDYYNSH